MTTLGAPQPLVVPEHFRFEWDTPEEAMQLWTVDMMHWPNGTSPLAATFDMPAFIRGMNLAAQELSMPFARMDVKVIHSYVYMSAVPYSLDLAKMDERMTAMQARMMQHVPGLYPRWQSDYEPEVRSINVETRTKDYRALSDRELSDWIETLVQKRVREGQLHFLAVFPAMGAAQFYEQLYTELLGEPKSGEHYELLQGFPNKSIDTGIGLWRLAGEARKRPDVLRLLRTVAPEPLATALNDSDDGSAFLGAVDEFLDEYGWRSNEFDIGSPTWKEEPSTVYKLIREYAAREDYDLEEEQRGLTAAREAKQRVALSRIDGPQRQMFEQVLAGAQQYLPIQEDHNFWIDQQGSAVERVPLLDAGRRLVESGRLTDVDEVFLLHYDELQESLRSGSGNMGEITARRRAERAHERTLAPPKELGTPIPADNNPRAMSDNFFGTPPEASADPRIINGRGASAGKVTGIARVVMTLDDADCLKAGEVLVCPATMPPWTPLFALAAAVVTNHGGALSHTAIVAREYQIPAVLATQFATELIRDGQRITVDGTAGTVKLED